MRKMTIEFKIGKLVIPFYKDLLRSVESFEMLEMLRLDIEKGVKIVLIEITLLPGMKIDNVKWPLNTKFSIIKENKNKAIGVISAKVPSKFKTIFKKFNMDVIWTSPTRFNGETMTVSCIGEEKELAKVRKVYPWFGEIIHTSYANGTYTDHNLLSVLTDKQKHILLAAKHNGYYDYPRKVNTQELAEKVGISKATVVEHLRKAEGRLMANILAGY